MFNVILILLALYSWVIIVLVKTLYVVLEALDNIAEENSVQCCLNTPSGKLLHMKNPVCNFV